MSNRKVIDEYKDLYDIYDDDKYNEILITEYVESSLYEDSPKYIKKLHYDKQMSETKDYYYICPYKSCNGIQPVLYEYKLDHNKFYHQTLMDKILYWVCCRF